MFRVIVNKPIKIVTKNDNSFVKIQPINQAKPIKIIKNKINLNKLVVNKFKLNIKSNVMMLT